MEPTNLLNFEPTISGQDFRLRKLGIAATAVMVALAQSGKRFITLLGELGPDAVKELLGEEGADQALEIAEVIAESADRLSKIYPTPGVGSGTTPEPATGSDAGAGQASSSSAPSPAPADATDASAASTGSAAGAKKEKPAKADKVPAKKGK